MIIRYVWRKYKPDPKKQPVKIYLYAIPAALDCFASGLMYVAYNFTAGSIVMMMQVTMMLWTAILEFIFLKKLLSRHHLIGLFLVMAGIILLGFGVSNSKDSTMLGYILWLIGNFA